MKLNHKQKIKLARKMRTLKELRNGVSIFQTESWERRKKAKADKIQRQRENNAKRKKRTNK